MVPADRLMAFLVAAVIIIVIPGPSVLFAIGRALSLGKLGGFLTVVGNTLGALPLVVAVALGVGEIITHSPVIFTLLKVAGAGYICFLGVQAFRHRRSGTTRGSVSGPMRAGRIVREGFVVGVSNPKTLAFFVAVLPQFVAPQAGNVTLQILELGGLFMLIGLVSDGTWALSAGVARDWFARDARRIATLTGIGGLLLSGLGLALLFLPS